MHMLRWRCEEPGDRLERCMPSLLQFLCYPTSSRPATMAERLSSFCIACARFAAGDQVGQFLAVVAAAPYFAHYHVAVLLHARRQATDAMRAPCAVPSPPCAAPSPLAVSLPPQRAFCTTLPPVRRELHVAFVFMGMLLTTGEVVGQLWSTAACPCSATCTAC